MYKTYMFTSNFYWIVGNWSERPDKGTFILSLFRKKKCIFLSIEHVIDELWHILNNDK